MSFSKSRYIVKILFQTGQVTLFFLLICILWTPLYAQNQISHRQFLAGTRFQEKIGYYQKKYTFLQQAVLEMPWVEKLELRTETNDFDWRKQSYLLRVSPNPKKAIQAQSQYQETIVYLSEQEVQYQIGKALKERYDLIIKSVYFSKLLQVKQRQKVLFSDKVTLLKRSATLPDFDILQLIDAEDDEQNCIIDILELENVIKTIKQTINLLNKEKEYLEPASSVFTHPEDISQILELLKEPSIQEHSSLCLLSAELYSGMMEYQWKAAQSQFSLAYIQAEFQREPDDFFRKSFSIGVGFDIPLRGAARLDLNKLQLKTFEIEGALISTRQQLNDQKQALRQQLNNHLSQYYLLKEQLDHSQAEFALDAYAKIVEVPPKALLQLRENTLKKEWHLASIELNIMLTYVDWLDSTGLLNQKPYLNYLSKNRERL